MKNNQDILVRAVCMAVFVVFTFVYLYCFQADLLTMTQHVLSKGQTHYNHLIGASLITLLLALLQVGVSKICYKVRMARALTFVPSVLCLILLTDACLDANGDLMVGAGVYAVPFVFLAYVLLLWLAQSTGFAVAVGELLRNPIRQLWVNLLVMFVSVLSVCLLGNSDRTMHVRLYAEQCLADGNYDEALAAIRQYARPDSNVTMLTAYALSCKGELADHLFEYNVTGGSRSLMPDDGGHRLQLLADSTFYSHLGGWYVQRMSTMRYLDYQKRHHHLNRASIDYQLCAWLMDRNLNAFAENIGKYYAINDSLPKHYREALTLYMHKHSTPHVLYSNAVMNTDYQDFQKMESDYTDERLKWSALNDTYANTYWFYYSYCLPK